MQVVPLKWKKEKKIGMLPKGRNTENDFQTLPQRQYSGTGGLDILIKCYQMLNCKKKKKKKSLDILSSNPGVFVFYFVLMPLGKILIHLFLSSPHH